jgi:hypothetical protein
MTVRIMKVDATATFTSIHLAVRRASGFTAPGKPGLLHALKDRIEVAIADVKRVMMRLERVGGIEIQG